MQESTRGDSIVTGGCGSSVGCRAAIRTTRDADIRPDLHSAGRGHHTGLDFRRHQGAFRGGDIRLVSTWWPDLLSGDGTAEKERLFGVVTYRNDGCHA